MSAVADALDLAACRQLARQAAADAFLERALAEVAPARSYTDYLRLRAVGCDARTALVFQDGALSYGEMFAAVDAVVADLRSSHGLRPGDRVLLNLDNSDRYVIVYLALLQAGIVAVPVNPKLAAREIGYIMQDCAPALYVTDPGREAAGREAIAASGRDVPLIAEAALGRAAGADRRPVEVDRHAPAAIFYTSGTTGMPKGVMHSHDGLIAGAIQMGRAWGYDAPEQVALAMTPLFHIAAHSWFLPVLANRGTLVIDSYRTEKAFELIDRHRVNSFGAVPAMLLLMARHEDRGRHDLTCVTNVRFGASPMPPDKLAEVQAIFPNAELFHGMGQTESGGTISVLPGHLAFSKAGSTGLPMAGYAVRIVDDAGRDLPHGEVGEVIARGPNVMLGYYGKESETEAALAEGWLRTGDLGYVDEDGCIYLVDRKKDMIIRGGENIYSVEVENVLTLHPSVVQAAVVGLPNPLLGEEVLAFVVPAPGEAIDAERLKAFCGEHLAAFKVPAVIRTIDQLPATATGKIQKAELRKLL